MTTYMAKVEVITTTGYWGTKVATRMSRMIGKNSSLIPVRAST